MPSIPNFNNFKLTHWIVIRIALILSCVFSTFAWSEDSSPILSRLEQELSKAATEGNAPSFQVAVIIDNKVILSRAYGENTSVDHAYMNASVQKAFTATAVLQLVERGMIDLDADVTKYLPFEVRHPDFPETPVTARMLLAHRSGLNEFRHQFGRDTESSFSPQFRPPCPDSLQNLSHEGFLRASLTPGGANYHPEVWMFEPGKHYHYSVSAYPLLRYLVSQVSGQSYAEYMHQSIFKPLGMVNSGFTTDEFPNRHAIPYTRIDGNNVELPLWSGKGFMMHTTAKDMAKFVLTLMNEGQYRGFQLLQPETVELMKHRTSRFKVLFKSSDDLLRNGHGLGLFLFRAGWFGNGGSAPGYQCLTRFNPSRKVGYVIMVNVNAILGGGENYHTARRDIYLVQDALISVLDSTLVIRKRFGEIGIIAAFVLYCGVIGFLKWRKKKRQRLS